MRSIHLCLLLIIGFLVFDCSRELKRSNTLKNVENAFQTGQLSLASKMADSLLNSHSQDSSAVKKLNSFVDRAGRILADFTLSDGDIEKQLRSEIGEYRAPDRELWERNNWLEYKVIDGSKRYFKRAVSNLKLILKSREPSTTIEQNLDPQSLFCLNQSRQVLTSGDGDGRPVHQVRMKINYQLRVKADVVPDGEIVRCWLPWPHENHLRQTNVKLLNTVPEFHFIAPDSCEQRSVYLEQTAQKGKPVIFELHFTYVSMAQYFNLNKKKIIPYDTTSVIFKKYSSEQNPQIIFTNEIKSLSDSIVKGVADPVEKVRKIYYWINDHVIWTGALEYSIIPFIPGYVLKNRRGDCGMQTLLFMAMARYEHIPVKWQSGWMMHPNAVNLHDWCEVYYNGAGWVPLDMSFNLQKSENSREKDYYISGIDAYRLIVNDGIGARLVPDKKFTRSEPYDFQRGEVEWRGGNLYFNQWDYQMDVSYN